MQPYVVGFATLSMADVAEVGGKNASLGEMIAKLAGTGVRVPSGFATTAAAFREFLASGGLDERIGPPWAHWTWTTLAHSPRPAPLSANGCWRAVCAEPGTGDRRGVCGITRRHTGRGAVLPTAEDLPEASFAGQQETYLNVRGLGNVLHAVQRVFASLYTDRAIAYRAHHGFDHRQVALSAGIQRMVRSDQGASGVIFTLDTESGFRDVVLITAVYGLGETLVQGG